MATSTVAFAQDEVIVHQPVDGLFVRDRFDGPPAELLGIVDTANATWRDIQLPHSTLRPFWSPDGTLIAFSMLNGHSGIFEAATGAETFDAESVAGAMAPFGISFPVGWASDSGSLAIRYGRIIDALNTDIGLYDVELETNTAQELYSWQSGQDITDIPLPPGANRAQMTDNYRIERNPAFDDWFVMQFNALGEYATFDIGEPVSVPINVLWNSQTNQFISLDAFVPDIQISEYRGDWSRDGTRLIVQGRSLDGQYRYIITFHFTPDQGAAVVEQAATTEGNIQHWLDAGDLFFVRADSEDGATYLLSEIVDGEYRETPFFTLNGEQFRFESFGDWLMQADEAAQHRLSCLFNWPLETRLSAGVAAQVVADDGVALPLRAAPDQFSAGVGLLPENEVVLVTGEPACSGGNRWQPIEASDGRTGWVVEADRSTYFLQVPTIPTDTPSPTATETPTPGP